MSSPHWRLFFLALEIAAIGPAAMACADGPPAPPEVGKGVRIVSLLPDGQLTNANGRLLKNTHAMRFKVVVENTTATVQKGTLAAEVIGDLATVYNLAREKVELRPGENRLLWVYWSPPGEVTYLAHGAPYTQAGASWGHELNVAWLTEAGQVAARKQACFAIDRDGLPDNAPRPDNDTALSPRQEFDLRYCGYLRNPAFAPAAAESDLLLTIDAKKVAGLKQGTAPSGRTAYVLALPSSPGERPAQMTFRQHSTRARYIFLLQPDHPAGPRSIRLYHRVAGDDFLFNIPPVESAATLVIEAYRGEERKGDGAATDGRTPAPLTPLIARAEKDFGPFSDYLRDDGGQAITSAAAWQEQRRDLKENIRKALALAERPAHLPIQAKVLSEEHLPAQIIAARWHGPCVRRKIALETEPGEWMNVWLLVPPGLGPFPAMVALHQTVQEGKDEPVGLGGTCWQIGFGPELVDRGFAVIAPDSPTVGERWDPRTQPPWDTTKKNERDPNWSLLGQRLHDHRRAIDYLETLPMVDARRIGAIGHSLGAESAVLLGGMDERVGVVVASCGFGIMRNVEGAADIWVARGSTILPPSFRKYLEVPRVKRRLPFDFDDAVALLAPRPVFAHGVNQEGVPEYVYALPQTTAEVRPLYRLLGAADRYSVVISNQGHCFPSWVQQDVFDWIEHWLNVSRR
jgi:dienelactone hydrolase